MELHERFVSAVLGALWGALLGLLVALFFHYLPGDSFERGFLIVEWKSTIFGCAGFFAAMGLIFKSSIATVIGTLINWWWRVISRNNEDGLLSNESNWVKSMVIGVLALLLYWYVKD
jgi:hypothetical protein